MPRLNFAVPADLLARIDASKPDYLDRKGFLCLLLASALDTGPKLPAYRVGAGTREPARDLQTESLGSLPPLQPDNGAEVAADLPQADGAGLEPEKKIKPKRKGEKYVFSVPADLDWCKTDLLEFWQDYKAGRKSRAAGALLIKGIRDIEARYGRKVVAEQLELAKAKAFESITLANYERFGLPRGTYGQAAPEPAKHPAGRLFMNGRFVDEEPATNPALAGMF